MPKTPVCTENLNPDIMVTKSTKNGVRFDGSGPLNWARDRRIFVERSMRFDVVIIACVRSQYPTQMRLVPDNDMIETLAKDRSDQPFGKAILPG
jgi:hypothetical protein